MKISAPIIAIMAASSSVASAKTKQLDAFSRKNDEKDHVLCPLEQLLLASKLADTSLRLLDQIGIPLRATYGSDDPDEPLQVNQVVLNSDMANLFDQTLGCSAMEMIYYQNEWCLMSDGTLFSTDGSMWGVADGNIQFNEVVSFYLNLVRDLTCSETQALIKRINILSSGVIPYAKMVDEQMLNSGYCAVTTTIAAAAGSVSAMFTDMFLERMKHGDD